MTTFHDIIADQGLTPSWYENDMIATGVLDMDEMRMIRTALNRFVGLACEYHSEPATNTVEYGRMILHNAGLTEPIIDWVVGG